MPQDRNKREIKKGDIVGVLFDVDEVTQEGSGTNLRLKTRNVPNGEHVVTLHINSGCVQLVGAEDIEKPTSAQGNSTDGDKAPPAP